MSEISTEIMSLLKEIDDDHDFVCGTMSVAGSESSWKKLRDYILYAKQNGFDVSADDILALSMSLREAMDRSEMQSSGKKSVRVAML